MDKTCHSNLADLRQGDEEQFWRRMKSRDVLADDIVAVGTNDPMLDELVGVFAKHRIFASPEEQIAAILRINESVWKDRSVTEEAIRKLGDPPVAPPSDEKHLWCVTLVFDTGDPVQTFARNWAACQFIHAKNWKWDSLILTSAGVQLRAGAIARPKGLRWSTAELGRTHKGREVRVVRSDLDRAKTMGIGQEGPFIAAMHPRWVIAMNGGTIPFMDMPDLEVRPNADARESFSNAPYLYFNRGTGEVELNANDVASAYPNCGSGVLGE